MKTLIKRLLNIEKSIARKSLFLFGPRQTGKSYFIKHQLEASPAFSWSLLESKTFAEFTAHPYRIRELIEGAGLKNQLVIVDEIQRCPELLNEIHLLIEKHNMRFLLTGSSARKLRSAGVNLLGGRAIVRELHPLTKWELGEDFNLERAFESGLLPALYTSSDVHDDLQAYIGLYLKEEIAEEASRIQLGQFARFLETAAFCHTHQLNFSALASDVGLARTTIQGYFQVLVDTLLGSFLEPLKLRGKRKVASTPKFYFFDLGVVKHLRKLKLVQEGTSEYGEFFEHLIYHHLICFQSYINRESSLHFWRTQSGHEVDFILNQEVAIEVKASVSISPRHLKGLKALKEEKVMRRYILVCRVPEPLLIDGIEVLPLENFLDQLICGL